MIARIKRKKNKIYNFIATVLIVILSLMTVVPLLLIVGYVTYKGFSSFSIDLITKNPAPVGETGGGVFNGIVGSSIILAIASLLGIPLGILGGLFLVEAKKSPLKDAVRLSVEILQGIPSIVIGIIVYILVVVPMHRFSALAGGIALSIMMLPIIVISTEEVLRLVPNELREAAISLGAPRWRVSLFVVLRTGLGGVISSVLLSLSRIAGETAPLLFTALGSQFFSVKLDQPIAALTLQIFNYSISPYPEWHSIGFAASFILVAFILVINITIKAILDRMQYYR